MLDLSGLKLAIVDYITREESIAIEQNEFLKGVDAFDLMQNAGKSIADFVINKSFKKITIIAGGGNNGGDGIVAAGILAKTIPVELILVKKPKTREAKLALKETKKSNYINIHRAKKLDVNAINKILNQSDIVVDAIFGVGLKSKVRSPYDQILQLFSSDRNYHLCCVDLPSGSDCNTGEWYCEPYNPDTIITMQFKKLGLLKFNDSEIITADIGISPESSYFVGKGHFQSFWPKRRPESHKGENGRIVVCGGSDEFTGAPVLAGMATLRAGIDTLRIAVPEIIRDIVAGYKQDFIVLKVKGDKFSTKGYKRFRDLTVNRHDAIAIGMGISNHPDVTKFILELFEYINGKIKVILDADAIRAFKGNLDLLKGSGAIITPHRAELRMMLDDTIPEEKEELIPFLQQKAKELGIVILLKGQVDIITDGNRTLLNATGHPGMTVGGTGDVLAGLVGAANCFIKDSFFATAIGAYIMGKTGEKAAEKYGNGLLASDIVELIAETIIELSK